MLKPDKYKDIIVESLKFLSVANRASVFGFVACRWKEHLQGRKLADAAVDYKYSTMSLYERGDTIFDFVNHYKDEIGERNVWCACVAVACRWKEHLQGRKGLPF